MKDNGIRYVCPKCKSVHHYRAKECQSCGFQVLKTVEPKNSNKKQDEQEMSEPSHNDRRSDAELRTAIDLNKLEEEWQGQPDQVETWTRKAAEATLAYDKAKSNVELVKARISANMRDDPESYGLSKITDKAVESAVICQTEYQKAVKAMHQAKYEMNVIDAVVQGLQDRKRSLTKLSDLWQGGYWSTPQVKEAADPQRSNILQRREAYKRSMEESYDDD